MNKIHRKWQLMLYAAAGMGVNMLNLMMGSYICSALLIGGFSADAIPYQTYVQHDLVIAAVWAVFVLAAKIIDGIIDVPMASFTDQLRSKWGRRRPALIIGMVPMIIAYLLFLVIPDPNGATLLNTIYYGVLLCVFYSFYTLTMVTYYATFTEIVDTEDERNIISNTKSVCDIVYFILGYVVVRMMLNSQNIRLVSLVVLPLVLTMTIPLFMIKEKSTLKKDVKAGDTKSVHLLQSLKCTMRNADFIKWMIVYSFMTFSVQLFLGGINEYFSFVGMSMIKVMVCAFVPVPFTLMLYNFILKKKGFGFAFRYILITYTVCMAALYIIAGQADVIKKALEIPAGLLCSLSIGALFAVAYSVPSQLAADEEKKTGVTNSAMYFAIQGLFSGVATGIATGLVLTALKGKEGDASSAISYMTLISAAGTFVALLFTFILPKSIIKMGVKTKE